MANLRLAASAAVSVLLLALCSVLAGPAFEMPALGSRGGLGAGALPQFVVVSTALLAVVIFIQDFFAWKRRGDIDGAPEEAAKDSSADARRVVGIGTAVLVLLAVYVFVWRWIGFLPASIGFMAVLCMVLAPGASRTARGMVIAAVTSILFCTGVWALFVYVLMVPLR